MTVNFDSKINISGGAVNGKQRWIYNYNVIIGDMAHQYLMRFIVPETEFMFFGCGLGDQASITQIGDSFLMYVDKYGDPELGRIVFSCGLGRTAFLNWRGDINLFYMWNTDGRDDWFPRYLEKVLVKPDIVLCPSKRVIEEVESHDYEAMYLPQGVGRLFHPLNLKREGLGYCGLDSKSVEMTDRVLGPFVDREDFEWISKEYAKEYLSLEDLNKWFNRKQLTFGMVFEHDESWGIIPGRFYASLASNTPLIIARNREINNVLNREYPYQTSSRKETVELMNTILGDYDKTMKEFIVYGSLIREDHHYLKRISKLIKYLEEWKK